MKMKIISIDKDTWRGGRLYNLSKISCVSLLGWQKFFFLDLKGRKVLVKKLFKSILSIVLGKKIELCPIY